MGLPRSQHRDREPQVKLLNGRRVLVKQCHGCKDLMELDLGPESRLLDENDAILTAMANTIVCDECAKKYESRKTMESRREAANRMRERKYVLPGFGKHVIGRSRRDLEFRNANAWTEARRWLETMDRSVFLTGDPDSGKTWLARTLVVEAWLKERTIFEVEAFELFSGELLFHSEATEDRLKRMRRVSVLYIQGLDRGQPKMKHLDQLLSVMDERYERGLVTIVESKLDGAGLSAHWTETAEDASMAGGILSRLHPVVKINMSMPKIDGTKIGMRQLANERVDNA